MFLPQPDKESWHHISTINIRVDAWRYVFPARDTISRPLHAEIENGCTMLSVVTGTQVSRAFHGYYYDYCFLPLYFFCAERIGVSAFTEYFRRYSDRTCELSRSPR
jgi:hypothetical protein